MPSSRGSSQPRDQTHVSCIADGFFTQWSTWEARNMSYQIQLSLRKIRIILKLVDY